MLHFPEGGVVWNLPYCINSNPLSRSNIPTLSIVTLLYGQAEIRLLSGAGRGRPRSNLNGLLTDLIFNT